ncbi:prestin isoform X2 [Megachile rotundata]|uniref:prestin isoform X2 n=1 Tax=Megachile rotundata TaxID=143995 RepID=UPI003FD0D8FC
MYNDPLNDYLSDDMSTSNPELLVRRPVYQQDELNHLYKYTKPSETIFQHISSRCQKFRLLNAVKQSIPLIGWLSAYNWKHDIFGDIVAGITVAVMHIPQGLAYAILGNVPPIVGIYMAFFPVLVYLFLGTSKHNSMGTFALVCMMTGKVVTTYSTPSQIQNINNATEYNESTTNYQYSPIEVATAVTFTVAMIELAMYVLRLGVIASLLADSLVSGFTTSAAVHVFTSQVKDLLGLKNLPSRKGAFKLIFTYVDYFTNIKTANWVAVALSASIIILLITNNLLKKKVARICPFPFPIEMLAVLIGTILSVHLNLGTDYGLATVGHIPVGFPSPTLPSFSLIPHILLDSFIITMVSYTITMSMALIFAQKLNYEVDSNQELMAQGAGNLVGSFFSCMPFTASLSRSLIQQTVGGHTQLASLISCGLLVSVLLWIGPLFEPLPRCVLASIIVVALNGMLKKVKEFKKFWDLDKMDGVIWAVTFITVILLDIEYGLLVGIFFCIGKLVLFAVRPYTCSLGQVPGTELYLDSKRYKSTVEVPGIKIFHYCGSLNFACRQQFREQVYKIAGHRPRKNLGHEELKEIKELHTLVLDLSALTHMDLAGATTLGNLISEYCDMNIAVYVAGCSGPVYEMMRKCNLTEYGGSLYSMFPTVADAVHFARCNELTHTPAWYSSM